jgi:hypothetical protein
VISFNSTFKRNIINNIPYNLFFYNTNVLSFDSTFEVNTISIILDIFKKNINVISFNSTFKENIIDIISPNIFSENTGVTSFNSTFESNDINDIPPTLFQNNIIVKSFNSTFKDNLINTINLSFSENINAISFNYMFKNNPLTEYANIDLSNNSNVGISFIGTFQNTEILNYKDFYFYDKGDHNYSYCFDGCINMGGTAQELWNYSGATGDYCFRNCSKLDNYGDIPTIWK